MVVKQKFELLKDVPNILHISGPNLKPLKLQQGIKKVGVVLNLMENKIDHFTKKKVFDTLSFLEKSKICEVINMPEYSLKVSFNKPTNQMIINLAPFGTDDIYPNNPDSKNVYASLVYAICFNELVNDKIKVPEKYYPVVSSFLTSMFVQIFGREYGLLGSYSSQIPKLKFLISTYVLVSFFGEDQEKSFKKAAISSGVNLKDIYDDLQNGNYNFSSILDFIRALSELKIMHGIDKYSFTNKIYKMLGADFIPALEDFSRFISIITTSSISGSNIVPTFIYKYSKDEYIKLLEISKIVFK
jgi:hypothetical protein